nr:hypothetical protein [Anaerosacchariphilus polymeriproducens]
MDEMEMSISLNSIKAAYVYTVIFIFVWWIYDFVKTGSNGLPFILLMSQNLVLLGIQLFLKWKLGKDEK